MKLAEKEIQAICEQFTTMESRMDFLNLLNYAKGLLYGENAVPFKLSQLTYYIDPKLESKRYIQFNIPKKREGFRTINAPCNGLKQLQYCLNIIFQAIHTPHRNAFGFIPEKSIVDNAKKHIGNLYVYNIDLKDFFPSIDQARVWGRLQHPPFNLNKKNNRLHIANMIAALCCHEMEVERKNEAGEWEKVQRHVLPQGAPTSPTLTNIICERLDFLLSAVAKRFGLRYSRYADDITFSSMHNVYQKDGDFLKELTRIVAKQGFEIKASKTRLQKTGFRQEVTGLIVSEDRVNVQQRYIKELRKWLYLWETYGYAKASSFFLPNYKQDKGHVKKGVPEMANVLSGKLEYLKMVKGQENSTYLKLRERYEKLTQKDSDALITEVLNIWENKGIEEAMNFYYAKEKSIIADDSIIDNPMDNPANWEVIITL